MELKALKGKIKSIKNIGEITKAMEAVSAVKMKKNQALALKARPFALEAFKLLKELTEDFTVPFLGGVKPKTNNIGIILLSSDRGLCGAFNSNVFREFERLKNNLKVDNSQLKVIAIGEQSFQYSSLKGYQTEICFKRLGDVPEFSKVDPILDYVLQKIKEGEYKEVYGIHNRFLSPFLQIPKSIRIFPISYSNLEEAISFLKGKTEAEEEKKETKTFHKEYEFEPSPQKVLESLFPFLIKVQIYHMIIESNAGEHSARLLAMRNARDNTKRLLDDLTLSFNKLRQSQITRELSEIVGGKEVLENLT